MPTHPCDGEAFVEHEAVAEVFGGARVEGSGGEVELIERSFASAIDDFIKDAAVAFGGVVRNEQVKIGGVLDAPTAVEWGVIDVGDAAVCVVLWIRLEVDFADEAVVRTGLAEGFAVKDGALFGDFDADDLGCGDGGREGSEGDGEEEFLDGHERFLLQELTRLRGDGFGSCRWRTPGYTVRQRSLA